MVKGRYIWFVYFCYVCFYTDILLSLKRQNPRPTLLVLGNESTKAPQHSALLTWLKTELISYTELITAWPRWYFTHLCRCHTTLIYHPFHHPKSPSHHPLVGSFINSFLPYRLHNWASYKENNTLVSSTALNVTHGWTLRANNFIWNATKNT